MSSGTPRFKSPPQPFPANQGSGDVNNPYYIEPMEVSPQAYPPLKDPRFYLAHQESFLFDSLAQEQNQIIGPPVDYYALNASVNTNANVTNYPYPQPNTSKPGQILPTTVDPLYNEPVAWAFTGPFRLPMYFAYAPKEPIAGEEGLRAHWHTTAWVARKEFEDAQVPRPPLEGDVLQVWKSPFFKDYSTNDIIPIPDSGFYFDVSNVEEDGHMVDSFYFVGYKLTLIRRSEFTPERKITPP